MVRLFLTGLSLFIVLFASAQTPGLIFKTAGTGASVLDPNNDGYTSATTNGFISNDQSESEIQYKPLVVPSVEPVADPGPGPDCGFTDIVDSGSEDPVFSYLDASNNLLFRFRMGNAAPNSKGYSILIDTDQKFGFSGPNADPNAVAGNAGFEIEIVLRTNFGVSLYDVDGTTSPILRTTLSYDNYAQKSIALTTNCGNADYFYDFYIPFATITGFFPLVTTSTPLRLLAVTSMNPAPAIGNNAVSDVGGIDDQAYGYNYDNIFQEIIDIFYPTPATGINSGFPQDRSSCPSITGSITVSSTSITGTSSEGNGTSIRVYKNGGLLGTTTVSSGIWTLAGVSGLVNGDVITASATAAGKSESVTNCSTLTVSSTCTSIVSSVTPCNSNKAFSGTGIPGAVINLYYGVSSTPLTPTSGSTFSSGTITVDGAGDWLWRCVGSGQTTSCTAGGGPCLSDGSYRVTQTLSGQCESQPFFICIGGTTLTATPVITTNPIIATGTSVSGTSASGAGIILYADGVQIGTTTASGTNWTVSGLTLSFGQVITAKAIAGTNCISNASTSRTVTTTTATPVIYGTYCTVTTVSTVSGTTTEASGTIIEVFSNNISVGTTTANANGAWNLTGLSLSSGATITATATATGKLVSAISAGVVIGSQSNNSGLSVNGPITEGQTSLSGALSGTGTVKVYIDGGLLGTATVAGSTWTLSGLATFDVYAGGSITATITSGANCESNASAGVMVQCVVPAAGLSVTPASSSLCQGETVTLTIGASESGIIYQLYNGAISSGSSKLGTGGDITLTSSSLSSSAVLGVRALKISPISCTTTLTSTHTANVTPTITSNTLTPPATTTFCGTGNPETIAGSTPAGGSGTFSYQWQSSLNNTTFNNIIGAVGQNYDPPVITNTVFYRRVVTSDACSNTSASITFNVQTTDLTNTITPTGSAAFCVNGDPSQINGSAPTGGVGGYTYQWQSSEDNNIFIDVSGGATSQNFDPSLIATTTYFRRLVSSGACSNFPSSAVKVSIATAAHTLITASTSSIEANGTSTSIITIQLRDASGPITSSGCLPVLSATTGTLSAVTDNGDGTYTATLTAPTTTSTAIITGTINGIAITDNETVNFVPGSASELTSLITAASNSISANGTSSTLITVQVKDANGNNITSGGSTIILSTTAGTLSGVTDNGNGTYTATLTSTALPATATITGTLNTITISDNEIVNFIITSADPTTSTITAASNTLIADGITTTVITVQAKNGAGVNLTTGGSTVSLSTTSGTLSSVVDNGDGTYTATLTSATTTGVATITGTIDGNPIIDNEIINFVPGAASVAHSTISAAANSIVANGVSNTLLTVQIKDANGNNITISSGTVTLATTLGILSSVTDNNDGTYTATLTSSTVTGIATITGTLNSIAITDDALVDFIPGPASATTSMITAASNTIIANGVSTTLITVQVKDANGNNLATGGANVTLLTTAGTLSSVIDNNNGTYTATLTSTTTAGVATLTGTLNSVTITDDELVNLIPGPPSNGTSVITATLNTIVANGSSSTLITVQTKDVNGNNLTVGGATVTLSTTRGTLSSVTDNNDGTYTATLTSSTTAGTATITGTLNTVAITDNEIVNFTPGPASPVTSTIVAASNSIIANGTSTTIITVQAKDTNGNNLTSGGDIIILTTTLGTLSAITDNGNGTYTAILTSSTTLGTADITGSLNSIAMTRSEAVDFIEGPPSPITSLIIATDSEIIANGTSFTNITIQTKDASGNNNTSGGAIIILSTTLGTLSSIDDNGDGTYSTILTSSTTTGTAIITGTLNGVDIDDNETVDFIPGPPNALTSTITAASNSIIANGSSSTVITIQTKDANGNNLTTGGATITLSTTAGTLSIITDQGDGTYTATLTSSTTVDVANITGTVNTIAIDDNELVSFIPGPASTLTSTITAASNSIVANGTSTIMITIQLKDANGNNVTTGGETITLSTTRGSISSITDHGDGTYTATLTSSITAGTAEITGTLNSIALTQTETVNFVSGPASATTSTIQATDNTLVANGTSATTITVQTKDANGNNLTTGGATITLSTTLGTLSVVTDNGDGTYTATLTSSTTVGAATLSGTLNSIAITDNDVVNFIPGSGSPIISLITAADNEIIANGTSSTTITVQIKDAHGNNLTTGGSTVTLSSTSGTLSGVTDNNNGTYTATLTSSTTTSTAVITGTLNSTTIADDASVTFIPGPASTATSTITATLSSLVANGTSTTTITVQLKDSNGNNLTTGGAILQLQTTGGTLSGITDNGDGTYTATLTSSTLSTSATITGTLNTIAITDNEVVNFTAGLPSTTTSTIIATDLSLIADGTSTTTITVQLKDINGNNSSTGGDVVTLSTTAGTLSTVTDNNNGTYTATLTSSTIAAQATITGTLNSIPIEDEETVAFIAGPVSALTTTITAGSNTIIANGTSTTTITVQAKDAHGNNLTTGGATVTLSTTLGTISVITDNNDGTYTAILTAPATIGTATITGTINTTSIIDSETVNFVTGGPSAITTTITASPDIIVANGVTTSTITVQLKDANNNNITTGGESVTLSSTTGTLTSVIDNGDGTYTAILTSSTLVETATITGTLNTIAIDDDADVNFVAGPASAATSTINVSSTSLTADGISTTIITIQLRDAFGNVLTVGGDIVTLNTTLGTISSVTDNGDGTYTATLTSSTTAGIATITGTLNTVNLDDAEEVMFTPGAASLATSTITAASATLAADGISSTVITVQLKDSNDNNITTGGETVTLATTAGTLSSVVDNGDGTYTATLTSAVMTSTATITGHLNGNAINDDEVVNFAGGAPSVLTTLITASTASITADGISTSLITIQLKDANGNTVISPGATLALSTTLGTLSSITDNEDGTYLAILTSATTTGLATLTGTLNGNVITDSETVTFVPGPPSAATSLIIAVPSAISADGSSTAVIFVQLKDAHGNNITIGGSTVLLAASAGILSVVTDNGDGTYSAILTSSMTPGVSLITGLLNGTAMNDTESVTFVQFTTTLTASSAQLPADGLSTSTITLTIRDANNNPVSGAAVQFTTSGGFLSAVTDNGDGTYTVTITATTTPETISIGFILNGIPATQTISITFTALPTTSLFIPEGFSPDGDGNNDTFIIEGAEDYKVSLTVYNRWGNIVYEAREYKNDWDGMATKGLVIGDKLPDGTYYYVVDLNNGEKPFVRYFTIKRK